MARFMIGTEGFGYEYIIGSKAIDLSLIARASGVGTLLFSLEYLVTFKDKDKALKALPWDEVAGRAGFAGAPGGGRYEAPEGEDPQSAFDNACAAELARVPAILSLFEDGALSRIELRGRAQFRLSASEWERMVEWLNSSLPAPLKLTVAIVRAFNRGTLERFNPDEDGDGDEAAGTRHAAFLYATNADRYLPYLGLRILTHAVQHNLASMTVEETDRLWRGSVWEAPLP
jgi:hypothetical protein